MAHNGRADTQAGGRTCPDGGACHHGCAYGCFRVETCEPLSGVFPDDQWPAEVLVLSQQSVRARRLALSLLDLGEGVDGTESQLARWGFDSSLCHEAALWAADRKSSAQQAPDALAVHLAHETPVAGCDLCSATPMLDVIWRRWNDATEEVAELIWSLQDGYGEPGAMPAQGYDWSGIRDSSPEAITAIYEALVARGLS